MAIDQYNFTCFICHRFWTILQYIQKKEICKPDIKIMKKTLYLITLIAILLLIAFFLVIKDRKGTLHFNYESFSVKDTSMITSISIKNNHSTLVLEREGHIWKVNQKYNANSHAINKLLSCIRHFEIISPVPRKIKNRMIKQLNDSSIIVSIGSEGDLLKRYRIIDSPVLMGGSVVLMDGNNDPYVINTVGFGGKLTVFFTTNAFMWRDRTIFRLKPQAITSVEVNYPLKTGSSFVLNIIGEKNALLRSVKNNKITRIPIDKALQYLSYFQWVPFHWIDSNHVKSVNDSLLQQTPYCLINVTNFENQVHSINIFQIPSVDHKGGFNMDKMYAKFQVDSIPVIVKCIDIDPIMKEYTDF